MKTIKEMEEEVVKLIGHEGRKASIVKQLGEAVSTVDKCKILKEEVFDFIIEDVDCVACGAISKEDALEACGDFIDMLKDIDEIWGSCDVLTDEPVEVK